MCCDSFLGEEGGRREEGIRGKEGEGREEEGGWVVDRIKVDHG